MNTHGGFSVSKRIAQRAMRTVVRSGGRDARPISAPKPAGDELFAGAAAKGFPPPGEADQKPKAPRVMKGFKYFPESPSPNTLIVNPHPGDEDLPDKKLREIMSGLARQMHDPDGFPWPDHSPDIIQRYPDLLSWENPRIPSGYTYLLQLVAHDLIATSFPISVIEDMTTGARNTRSAALRLDTIYGGGPAVCPIAYMPNGPGDVGCTALRLGRMKAENGVAPGMRDIPRMPAPGAEDAQQKLLSDVAIPDPRNDDNPIIAQLVVLFHLFHQAVLDMLVKAKAKNAESDEEAAMERFLCARGAVTLVYRNIIRKDLLEKILHPAVYQFYRTDKFYNEESPGFKFVDEAAVSWDGDSRIPLEFSHGAFRFGHAMVRRGYRFNETNLDEFDLSRVLSQTSKHNSTAMPLGKKWIARWSYFFDFTKDYPGQGYKRPPNFSRRIGPGFSVGLISDHLFPPVDGNNLPGLAYRDLLSGAFLKLPSVDRLIDTIERTNPALYKQSMPRRVANYEKELTAFMDATHLSPDDRRRLIQEPPLAFFVLLEAAADPTARGLHLGPLGSIIVADVILAAMTRDPVTGETEADDLAGALRLLSKQIYKAEFLGELGSINSMAGLIKFVESKKNLQHETPAFI